MSWGTLFTRIGIGVGGIDHDHASPLHSCMTLFPLQAVGLLGAALAALYVFQEKILYVPIVPGVPPDYWITADKYGLASEVR